MKHSKMRRFAARGAVAGLALVALAVTGPRAAWAQNVSGAEAEPKTPQGRTTFRISAEALAAAEQRLSPELRELRKAYRLAGLSATDAQRRERMARLAQAADARLPAAAEVEQFLFLRLAQDAYAEAGDMPRALERLAERTERLQAAEPSDAAAREVLAEATLAQVKKRFPLAHGLAEAAAGLAASAELRHRCRLERGRIHESESGPGAAGEYYLDLAAGAEEPALACAARLLGARALKRADALERAIRVLDELIALHPESPEARDAQSLRDDWLHPGDDE